MAKAQLGLIGLGVMGENLALNLEEKGFSVALYNREADWVDAFLQGKGAGKRFLACPSLQELVNQLEKPRKIWMMIRAGAPVDGMIDVLMPLLDSGDILIDGGNSNYRDSMRRAARLEAAGLRFVGCGVSGGAEGARRGPALMPGGSDGAWEHVQTLMQAICARAEGEPCCQWLGENGSGHFVKMVHNGIEYGDMQLICEIYQLMRDLLGMSAGEMADLLRTWNRGRLQSYLMEITAAILDRWEGELPVVEEILDAAGQKGTGKWTGISALEQGVPLPTITEAVFARCISARRQERQQLAQLYPGETIAFSGDRAALLQDLEAALYGARILCYAQGFDLMRTAAQEHGWRLNYGGVARIWRGGCIIRSALLKEIAHAFDRKPELESLLLDEALAEEIRRALPAWRRVCAAAIQVGVPAPALCSGLNAMDGLRCTHLPANLLQAQRDYFGAHGYERVDRPRGIFFHRDWQGDGEEKSIQSYNA